MASPSACLGGRGELRGLAVFKTAPFDRAGIPPPELCTGHPGNSVFEMLYSHNLTVSPGSVGMSSRRDTSCRAIQRPSRPGCPGVGGI